MGTEIPTTKPPQDDDIPLAQRLLELKKKRAAELASSTAVRLPEQPVVGASKSATIPKIPKVKAKPDPGAEETKVKVKPDPGAKKGKKMKRDSDFELPAVSERDSAKKMKVKVDPSFERPSISERADVRKGKKIKKDPGLEIPTIWEESNVQKRKIKKDPGPEIPAIREESTTQKKKDPGPEIPTASEGDEEYRWWEEQNNDGSVKWTTLEHNGLFFPPPYVPHGVKMRYAGQTVDLEAEAEEVASFFAAIIGTDHYENEIFRGNFFEDFCSVLHSINSKWRHIITEFEKCDFSPIVEHLTLSREQKKTLNKEEKEKLKAEKTKIEEFYGWCMLDGRREKVGNFRVEPPGLFRGRGKHPKAGKLKLRVKPEQITINIGEGCRIPAPPEGTAWGNVVHDNTVTWLANWTENINKAQKYVFLAAGSSLKGQSDLKKFEIARELKKHVGHIRKVNEEELRSKEMFVRQRATALWLIDHLALRAGNEKGEDEADTVGCCSLRCEHLKLQEPNIVVFDFLGKDSIRYYNEVPVDAIIFKNLGIFMRSPKTPEDPVFDRLNTGMLNKYLNTLMSGLTAKVFRTFNASHTFQEELKKTPDEGTVHDLVLAYNRANRQVAILCNHQRSIPKTHQQSMEKLSEKILTMKYQRYIIRKELKDVASSKELKNECPEAIREESDMDDETIKRKEEEAEEVEKAKSEREGNSQDAKGKSPDTKGRSPKTKKNMGKESLIKKFNQLTSRIDAAKNQRTDRDENKTTALGTSKTNYIDPRITTAWCQKHNVPIEKLFNKSLRDKFKWAMTVGSEWKF